MAMTDRPATDDGVYEAEGDSHHNQDVMMRRSASGLLDLVTVTPSPFATARGRR